jgi:ectoine hydroxylase-related dioxygenase (phytanoyl-CoA dioxygenase family)
MVIARSAIGDHDLFARGRRLDRAPETLGALTDSTDLLGDIDALRARMGRDGYLFLPGYLDRDEVLASRRVVTDRLAAEGLIDTGYPADEAVALPESRLRFKPDVALDNVPLHRLLYSGRMIAFYERFLGGAVRHYDFTWMRVVAPGLGTSPHGDVVFMGRGTHDLYTSWVPLGDVSLDLGGLIVLEGSHTLAATRDYLARDVDTYCENVPGEAEATLQPPPGNPNGWTFNGTLSEDPVALRAQLGGRWLTAEYRAGDLLVFMSYTIHASLDNRSDRVRLSSDSRYQLASAPIDERWIGEAPIGHGPGGKRGLIC